MNTDWKKLLDEETERRASHSCNADKMDTSIFKGFKRSEDTFKAGAELPNARILKLIGVLEWVRRDIKFDRKEDSIVRKCDEVLNELRESLQSPIK